MKVKFLFISFVLLAIGLGAANNKNLIGTWEIVEFKLVQKGVPTISDEKTLRDSSAVWNMYFSEDGSFKQEFNMRNSSKKMETEKGIWSTGKDSLFIKIQMDTISRKLSYNYVGLGDAMVLTLHHPTTPDKIVTKFRRRRSVK